MTTKNVRAHAYDILERVRDGAYSHLLVNDVIEKQRLSAEDAGLLTELVYGVLKQRPALDFYMTPFLKQKPSALDRRIQTILQLSLYQMAFLDRIPNRAAIHEGVNLAKANGRKGLSGMVNGVLRNADRKGLPDPETIQDEWRRKEVQTGHPVWLLQLWANMFGKETAFEAAYCNLKKAPVTLRTNTLQQSREALQEILNEEGVATSFGKLAPEALITASGQPAKTEAFASGRFSIQDEASMLCARALDPKPGMQVLDACAAPGGKALHLMEWMQDEGFVTASDLHATKLPLIHEQAERLGLTSFALLPRDARQLSNDFAEGAFDRVLVDAPCSGLGVIRRKPEIKAYPDSSHLKEFPPLQEEILHEAAKLVKPGGRLVYSTCTLNSEENEAVVKKFLHEAPGWKLEEDLAEKLGLQADAKKRTMAGAVTILPQDAGSDGFFIASLFKE
ncbi:16S rRNA (cytosine967-C5)-methyltransferase [Salsuginibacillus halophilus]|uniref:16S rRNA (cytosine(967)-C(5))-methyltransferase n=1 Tax=Salsuginibacillus halophilus TaxID=517424 RepID=A0A2P8HY17_9BACI|nr:16S rRNA (cytosine(967)-C(5))-methyltransferase RsmB [Salsuginibacillus halophilus]PSL51141.1 16S rRNA (cytosine967-C5)-methyltransferase [Salsuginibacillus halophilus]